MESNVGMLSHAFYNASAGSGKTFKLCNRYIALLLGGSNAGEILTITFTNKAANEMKSRIMQYLYDLYSYFTQGENALDSKRLKNVNDILKELEKTEYNITKDYIKANIEKTYFDFLSADKKISTIDSFFNSILKKFALYIGMRRDFEIQHELQGFSDFLKEAYLDSNLIVIMRILQQELNINLKDSGYNNTLNLENTLENLYDKTLEFIDFRDFDYKLSKEFVLLDSKDLIEKNDFKFGADDVDSIKNKIMESMDNLAKILQDFIDKNPNKNIEKIINNLKSYDYNKVATLVTGGSNHGHIAKSIKDSALREKIDIESELLNDLCIIHENHVEGTKLQSIHSLIESYKRSIENKQKVTNIITFDTMQHKVFDIITNRLSVDSNTFNKEYFYFRLDSNFKHILFDEYQDTSVIQYRIFKPLFDEFMSQDSGKSLFFVGDSKQSLYAFRGASKEVFENSTKGIKQHSLDTNFRSCKNIVDFVNTKFLKVFGEENYKIQNCNSKVDGVLDVEIVDNEECFEAAYKKLQYLLDSKINASDIVILARFNKTLQDFIDYAKENGFTREFNLENSNNLATQKVTKIISSAFKTNEYANKIHYLESAKTNLDSILNNEFEKKKLLLEINETSNDKTKIIESTNYRINNLKKFQRLQQKTLNILLGKPYNKNVEISINKEQNLAKQIKNLIESLELYHKDYVQDSMNLLEIASQNPQIESFESLKEILQNTQSVSANMNAIKAMSVHKSKGLGFPFVIYIDMIPAKEPSDKILYDYNGIYLDSIRLSRANFFSEKLENLQSRWKERNTIQEKNTMYVACTRAQFGLYIIATYSENAKGEIKKSKLCEYLDLKNEDSKGDLESTLKEIQNTKQDSINDNKNPLIISNLITNVKTQSEFLESSEDSILQTISMKQKALNGECMHLIFELLLGYKQSRENALNIAHSQFGFYLNKDKILQYYTKVEKLLESKEFKENLLQNFKETLVKCELSFLQNNDGNFSIKRMDCVIYDSHKFYILEFKSSEKLDSKLEKEHKSQLENYINFAKNIFKDSIESSKKDIKGFLIYPELENSIRELES